MPALPFDRPRDGDNEPALIVYKRHGVEVEGHLLDYALREGIVVDAVAMARVRRRAG